jgi:hypothetical protein
MPRLSVGSMPVFVVCHALKKNVSACCAKIGRRLQPQPRRTRVRGFLRSYERLEVPNPIEPIASHRTPRACTDINRLR